MKATTTVARTTNRRNGAIRTLVLGLAMALALSGYIAATSVPRMDLATLVQRSDSILQGKVETIEVRVDEKLRLPFTWVRLRVDDPLKGERRQTVFVRHIGGKAAGSPYTIAVAGMPRFEYGGNVIVFLRDVRDGSGAMQVVGLNQGKYEVVNEVAIAQISGVELIDPKTGNALPSGYVESAPVEAFKAKIRELVR